MVICKNDEEVRNAISNNEQEIGIRIIDNASNAVLGYFAFGIMGSILSQQKNTTPSMQAILQEAGYKYQNTRFVIFKGNVMVYQRPKD